MNRGVFDLILRSVPNESGRILTASTTLKRRIAEISSKRKLMPADIKQTHDFFIDSVFKPLVPVAQDWVKSITADSRNFSCTATFVVPKYGDFLHKQFIHVVIDAFGDPNGTTYYRYCNLPGVRLFEHVHFECADPLDNYTSDDILFYDKMEVTSDKRAAWNDCIGQQNPRPATLNHLNEGVDEVRIVYDGPQTLKRRQPQLSMMIPLHFWPKNLSTVYPIIATDALRNVIRVQLAEVGKMIEAFDAAGNRVPLTIVPNISTMELYSNLLFVPPDLSAVYFERRNLQLVQVHKRYKAEIIDNISTMNIMKEIKHPIETIYFGMKPSVNNTGATWSEFCKLTERCICVVDLLPYTTVPLRKEIVSRCMHYYERERLVNFFGMTVAATEFIDSKPSQFYDSYLPYSYDDRSGIAGKGECVNIYSFGLIPLYRKNTGFIDASVARETILNWSAPAENINATNTARLYVSTNAYQVLIVQNNRAALRFAT